MKRKIGIAAAVLAVMDLFVYMILIVTGNAFANRGLTGLVFVLWFVFLAIAGPCLIGDVIKFVGKHFSSGFNAGLPPQTGAIVYCTKCGKPIAADVSFCPHCGDKK